jgi:hypothetical protein
MSSFKSSEVQTGAARIGDAIADISESAAEGVDKAAENASDAIRDATADASEVGAQIKRHLEANPAYALLGAMALGFVVGRFMSRN